ncbi:hypothetical protein TWF481_009117 [Arthrobotrys musiformis]|uniref:F-box domain-containing protein n=1 Tax=Arthrobotrys musiformis TaxID=47236 RepID=A0AAV9W2T3_9PEZI
MASIITLTATPEILDHIFEYLWKPDVWVLALTCKSLYPACIRFVWRNLEVTRDSPFRKPGTECAWSLCYVIKRYWADASWLQYTKFLNVGRHLNSTFEDATALLWLLEGEKVRPNCVELIVDSLDIDPRTKQEADGSLLRLKRYSESRSHVDFSIKLVSAIQLAKLIDLPKVTHLAIQCPMPTLADRESGMQYALWIKGTAEDLAQILDQTTNLKHFGWAVQRDIITRVMHYSYPNSSSVDCVRETLQKLKYVTSFSIHGYLLHPTIFIAPPPRTRKFTVDGIMSQEWWEGFARCPFSELKSLTLRMEEKNQQLLRWFLQPGNSVDPVDLKGMAVSTLENIICEVKKGPPNLMV